MEAIAMVIWLGVTPTQLQAVQSAQPGSYRQNLIRVQDQRAQAEHAIELGAPRDGRSSAPPSSMR
jgi:hypothetical protein